jgi:VIT1/CCC1 family predicted Fe2+/Mn2+ transporter
MTFVMGAAPPLIIVLIAPADQIGLFVSVATLGFLALLGSLGAFAGGAGIIRGAMRVTLWGAVAMAATAVVGSLFHAVV